MKTKLYRLKHRRTGLYYTKGTLSEKGKIYTSASNYMTYLGNYSDTLTIRMDSRLYKNHKEAIDNTIGCSCTFTRGMGGNIYFNGLELSVHATDFEKEYINEQ